MNQCSPLQLPSSGEDLEQKIYLHQFLPTFEASSLFSSPLEEGSRERDSRRRPIIDQEVKEEMFFSGSDSLGSEATAEDNGQGEECKWMSSKMRFMKKMKSAETSISSENSSSSSPNGSIRVCSECNTSKTPLWRSGPCGPKSLCNACGIRQRKARRAMAAAVSGGLIPAIAPPIKKRKPKKSSVACSVPFKKRFKCFSSPENRKKFHCDEITISLSNSALPRVFPQDEKEAAILLMALSCGLLRR